MEFTGDSMDTSNLTLGLALLAGLASFLSPCVLALVPAYVGYLGGRSVRSTGEVVENRWETFTHGIAFVIGFSLVFVALGAVASALGSVLYSIREWLTRVGGVVVILFGLHTMGVINIPFLDYDTRRQTQPNPSLGYVSSFLMGIFFSAGWAPCVGPVLGAILTLALNSAQLQQGVVLLSAYSLGLAIPFLLAALGIGRVAELMRRHSKTIRVISIATGVVLVVVGILLLTGTLEQLARFGFFVDFGL
jgi:cytochrome c-type biogenesis protein